MLYMREKMVHALYKRKGYCSLQQKFSKIYTGNKMVGFGISCRQWQQIRTQVGGEGHCLDMMTHLL